MNAKPHLTRTEPVASAKPLPVSKPCVTGTAMNTTLKCPANARMKPNEIPFKQWCYEAAQRLGITEECVLNRIYAVKDPAKRIPYPPVRRVNARVVFVILNLQ